MGSIVINKYIIKGVCYANNKVKNKVGIEDLSQM